jgi:hypothetical protein
VSKEKLLVASFFLYYFFVLKKMPASLPFAIYSFEPKTDKKLEGAVIIASIGTSSIKKHVC